MNMHGEYQAANGLRAFLAQGLEYATRYYHPNTEVLLVGVDGSLDEAPFGPALCAGLQTRAGMRAHILPIERDHRLSPAGDCRGPEFRGFYRCAGKAIRGQNVIALVNNPKYAEPAARSLERAGCADYCYLAMRPGAEGLSFGMYGQRVEERSRHFADKVRPWLDEMHHFFDSPHDVIGIAPLGDRVGEHILAGDRKQVVRLDPANSDFGDLDLKAFKGRMVLIADSVYHPDWEASTLTRLKSALSDAGALNVLYAVEFGPIAHPNVDFALRWSNAPQLSEW